jgi:hypothetical protein
LHVSAWWVQTHDPDGLGRVGEGARVCVGGYGWHILIRRTHTHLTPRPGGRGRVCGGYGLHILFGDARRTHQALTLKSSPFGMKKVENQ